MQSHSSNVLVGNVYVRIYKNVSQSFFAFATGYALFSKTV